MSCIRFFKKELVGVIFIDYFVIRIFIIGWRVCFIGWVFRFNFQYYKDEKEKSVYVCIYIYVCEICDLYKLLKEKIS